MPRLIWSPRALADVQRIYRFLAEKSKTAATRAVKAIRASTKTIEQHPEIGQPQEGMDEAYRQWLIDFGNSGYAMLYHYDGDTVLIVAVRHQREAGY
jgi:plasmid stabilization system protein ParE